LWDTPELLEIPPKHLVIEFENGIVKDHSDVFGDKHDLGHAFAVRVYGNEVR